MLRMTLVLALALMGSAFAFACGDDNTYSSNTPTNAAAATTTTGAATSPTAAATSATSAASTSTASAVATSVKVAQTTTLGQVITDASGFTLYTFANDTPGNGKSACSGGCATAWPAATVTGTPSKPAALSGDLATIKRDDGSTQLTYAGHPLYRYAADKAPGDTNGEGVGGVWHAAKATSSGASTTTSTDAGSNYGGY